MNKASCETSEQVESGPFKLELPSDLAVEPKWKVPLSPTRIALIYPVETTDPARPAVRYDVTLVNARTGVASTDGYYRSSQFVHLHDVKQFLIDASARLNIKKRTRKTTEVDEEGEG